MIHFISDAQVKPLAILESYGSFGAPMKVLERQANVRIG